jgi:site-specific DNA-methyltransferase (adenine-specific)
LKPYYEHGGITIYHGDCREILPGLLYDVIVCDPPYGRAVELSRRGNQTIVGDHDTEVRDFICGEMRRQIMFGSPFVPRPACDAVLIWDKSELTGMGDLEFPWKMTHEEIYVSGDGFKSNRRRGSVLRHPLRPAWTKHPDAVSNLHPTEKPLKLMVELLECCPWQVVADPTCGSGTTLVAAKRLGKAAIGIEIEEKYCEIAAKRLSQEVFKF